MSATSDLLFAYLRNILYYKPDNDYSLDISKLEEDYVMLGQGLVFFAQTVAQYHAFAKALSKGDLGAEMPPRGNELASPLKSLQANLKHLTYQTQQVAKGDYKQRVDFMGEFADAFNTMVEQLADRQQRLEEEVDTSRKRAEAMEQSNILMSMLTQYIAEQIIVYSTESMEVLHSNELAKKELDDDSEYIFKIVDLMSQKEPDNNSNSFEIRLVQDRVERFLSVVTYQIEWFGEKSVAMVVTDISAEKIQLMELEKHAYRDALTNVYNRFYGMLTLNDWLNDKKRFALIFSDLDSLKYVNDKHGHREGDRYIIKVAEYLGSYSCDAVVCRLGGDEYMLLVPNESSRQAHIRMAELQQVIQNDEYLEDKEYSYSISYGIVAIDEKNHLSASEILSVADARMYKHKRERKKARATTV